MKKVFLFLILSTTFFVIGLNNVRANTFYGIIQTESLNTTVRVRATPNTSGASLHITWTGQLYTLVDLVKIPDQGGCSEGWYQIYYSGSNKGYMCSKYLDIFESKQDGTQPVTACEIELSTNEKTKKFPASYWGGLCKLKEKYPNWSFEAVPTNLEWQTAVEKESACRISYTTSTNPELIDLSCVGEYKDTWYPASQKAVAYYMDPRNFFAPRTIFQFEYLKYALALESFYPQMAKTIIGGTQFFAYHQDLNIIMNQAGSVANVNPVFIASRVLQELGSTNKLYNLYSGIYDGHNNEFYNYYNFYNIGVSDACATTLGATYCGLNYAKNSANPIWNSVYSALLGGATNIANNYINKGQYTTYLQRYNVVPTEANKLYSHQYMTNLAAPLSESASAFKGYLGSELLNSYFVFHIPVYENMHVAIHNSNSGAIGDNSEDTLSNLPVNTIVTSAGYRYSQEYITKILPGTTVENLKNTLAAVAGKENIEIFNAGGNLVNEGLVGTGYKVKITNVSGSEILEIVIKGDTSGDGVINALDLLQVQKSILKTYTFTKAYLQAADTSGEGKVDALDLLQIQKSILNTFNIEQ